MGKTHVLFSSQTNKTTIDNKLNILKLQTKKTCQEMSLTSDHLKIDKQILQKLLIVSFTAISEKCCECIRNVLC